MENNSLIEKIKSNLIPIVFGGAGLILIITAAIVLSRKNTPQEKYQDVTDQKFKDCDTKKQKYIVDGGTDLFPPGTEVEIELNYYACNKGERDDIVMVKTPGREQPLIKAIKMIPGDSYKVVQSKDQKFRIEVNGDNIENFAGEEYALSERKMRMIKLYESNFKNGIKDDVYFVFGESTAGGFDSTRFGPIMPERMVGKVLTKVGDGVAASVKTEEPKQNTVVEKKATAIPADKKPASKSPVQAVKQKANAPVKPVAKPTQGKPGQLKK